MFGYIWNLKVQALPVLCLTILYLLPNQIRKFKSLKYAPLYFAVPPFCNSNALIHKYYMCVNKTYKPKSSNTEEIKRKVVSSSIFSFLFEACVWPLTFGGIAGFFIRFQFIEQLMIVIFIIRLFQFSKSIYRFHKEEFSSKLSELILLLIYITFIYLSLSFLYKSFCWIDGLVISGNYSGILISINDYLLKDLIMGPALCYVLPKIYFSALFNGKELTNANNLYFIQNAPKEDNKVSSKAIKRKK